MKMRTLSDEQRQELHEKARSLIKWLNDNTNPHTKIIITPTSAELVEGVSSTGTIMDYVKD